MKYKQVHQYWGSDKYDNRRAEVEYSDGLYTVLMYQDNILIESRDMQTGDVRHSERYAEDCAENFVMGIIYP